MEAELTLDNAVTLIRYRPDTNSLAKALDLSQRLQGVSPKTRILITSWRINLRMERLPNEASIRSKGLF
jgi:hypothetical protein